MTPLISGAVGMASLVIALFFLRFWRSSSDRFFLYFAFSFTAQAIDRALIIIPFTVDEVDNPFQYLVRLLAYALILWAVFDKNRPSRRSGR